MPWKNDATRWGDISQLLHWLVVALILLQGPLGLLMANMPNSPDKIRAYALHKSIGLTVLALAALRLAWRLHVQAPAPVPGTPPWQERAARISHALLYALLFAIPLSGWLFNSASGYPLQWFKLFNLPAIAGSSEALADLASQVHVVGFWLLVLLVAAHAGAALYHHFVQRDDTLRRMLPQRRRAPGPIQQTPGGMA